ncbi:unnamed protein product [Caenorhabditis sp. 36 PRJEB53466]|nr:unnamed protein product [Caenorhabditis sp. 36 PRJEB53466]
MAFQSDCLPFLNTLFFMDRANVIASLVTIIVTYAMGNRVAEQWFVANWIHEHPGKVLVKMARKVMMCTLLTAGLAALALTTLPLDPNCEKFSAFFLICLLFLPIPALPFAVKAWKVCRPMHTLHPLSLLSVFLSKLISFCLILQLNPLYSTIPAFSILFLFFSHAFFFAVFWTAGAYEISHRDVNGRWKRSIYVKNDF